MIEVVEEIIEVEIVEEEIVVEIGDAAMSAVWGMIEGEIRNQTDLMTELGKKADTDDLGALALKDKADWDRDLENVPASFPPAAHDHDGRYYTETETDALLANKSDVGHDHDGRYYTETETDALLANKSDVGHTHDDRYYTETEIDNKLLEKADIIKCSVSGDMIHIEDGAAYPVTALSVEIEPVQDLNGYDYPWPPGGWKNILKDAETMDGWDKASSYVSISDGVATFRGTSSNWDGRLGTAKYPISLYNGTTNYVWSFEYSSTTDPCLVVPVIASFSQSETASGYTRTKFKTLSSITLANTNGEWVKVQVFSRTISVNDLTDGSGSANSGGLLLYNRSNNLTIQVRHMQLEKNSTDTDFAPYTNICPINGHNTMYLYREDEYDPDAGPKITIDLNDTRYGGSLDILTGSMRITHRLWSSSNRPTSDPTAITTGSGNTSFWIYAGNTNRVYYNGVKSDTLRFLTGAGYDNVGFKNSSSYPYSINIFMPTTLVGTTSASINTYLNAHPINFWLQLVTPQTIQLSPETLTLLLGENYIWADTGDTSVSYRADTKLYIDGKIADAIAALGGL